MTKKVKTSTLKTLLGNYSENDKVDIAIGDFVFSCKKYLTPTQTYTFAKNVIDAMNASTEGQPEDFSFELFDYAFMANVIVHFTNISLPADENMRAAMLYGSSIFDEIMLSNAGPFISILKERCYQMALSHLNRNPFSGIATMLSDSMGVGNQMSEEDIENIKSACSAIASLSEIDQDKLVDVILDRMK